MGSQMSEKASLMPLRRPADTVLTRRLRARATEVPLHAKTRQRPSLSHHGPIDRQTTRPTGVHSRSLENPPERERAYTDPQGKNWPPM
jgi:hypothetical protein